MNEWEEASQIDYNSIIIILIRKEQQKQFVGAQPSHNDKGDSKYDIWNTINENSTFEEKETKKKKCVVYFVRWICIYKHCNIFDFCKYE